MDNLRMLASSPVTVCLFHFPIDQSDNAKQQVANPYPQCHLSEATTLSSSRTFRPVLIINTLLASIVPLAVATIRFLRCLPRCLRKPRPLLHPVLSQLKLPMNRNELQSTLEF